MKKVDDKKIINLTNSSNYEIKTTSLNILNKYELVKNKIDITKKNKQKKKKIISFSILFGGLSMVLATSLVIGLLFNKDSINQNNTNFITPNKSSDLFNELISFSNYNDSFNIVNKTNLMKFANSNINEDEFNFTVEIFDQNLTFVNNFLDFNHKKLVSKNTALVDKYELNNKTYKYLSIYYYEDKEFFKFYYNDLHEIVDDDEKISSIEAIYIINNKTYLANINKKVEQDEDEFESEFEIKFVNQDDNNDCYIIKSENEIEDNEIENSYSILNFESYSKFNDNEYKDKIIFNYELEDNETDFDFEIKDKNDKFDYIFNHINKTNNIYTFNSYIKNVDKDFDLELKNIKLEILENNSHSYTYQEYKKII